MSAYLESKIGKGIMIYMEVAELNRQYSGVLAWVIQNTAVSPCDCYVLMKTSQRYVQFQKKSSLTRKNLIKKLINDGIEAIYIRNEEQSLYNEFLERFLRTSFAEKKIIGYIKQSAFHLLEFPKNANIPINIRTLLMDSMPPDFFFDFLESHEILDVPSKLDQDKEARILEILYSDVGLGSDGDQEVDNKKHDEIIELMNEMSTLREENDQLRERLKKIDEKEKEVRLAYDELYSIEGDKNHLLKVVGELQRKLKLADSELQELKASDNNLSLKSKKEQDSLARRLEEARAEARDFKLKYAREVEDSKKAKKELVEVTSRLNKTAIALKKVSNK